MEECVVDTWETTNSYKTLVAKLHRNKPDGRPMYKISV